MQSFNPLNMGERKPLEISSRLANIIRGLAPFLGAVNLGDKVNYFLIGATGLGVAIVLNGFLVVALIFNKAVIAFSLNED